MHHDHPWHTVELEVVVQSHGVLKGSCNHLPDWVHAKRSFSTSFITPACWSITHTCFPPSWQHQGGASPQNLNICNSACKLSWAPILFYYECCQINKITCILEIKYFVWMNLALYSGYLTQILVLCLKKLLDSWHFFQVVLIVWGFYYYKYYKTTFHWQKLFQLGHFFFFFCI